MISAWHSRGGISAGLRDAIALALSRYGGKASAGEGDLTHFHWAEGTGLGFGQFGSTCVLLQGWIDNAAELAEQLAISTDDPAIVYATALARWGDEADAHCIGNYCAIAELPGGNLRLARSPWEAPPLYYHANGERVVASPLHRVLFAAGAPRELDYDRIIDELAYAYRDGEEAGWYRGIKQVPLGYSVTITPEGHSLNRWYSVESLPEVRFPMDADYPEAANALLEEGAARALADCAKPAVALSGGLDSPLAASALTRVMPQTDQLSAITFVPHPHWDGSAPPGTFGSDETHARAFADFNGRIDLHLADPQQGGFDYRAREMFQAMELFAPGLANVGMFHGVWDKARALGCDVLMTADFGNRTFSDAGRWGYVEYCRIGKWGELAKLLRNRPHDSRSLPRKLAALTILPQLPPSLRKALRGFAHPTRKDMTQLFTLLREGARGRNQDLRTSGAWDDLTFARSRAEASRQYALQANGLVADVNLAFEQLYGLRRRDVTAYRPLIEFCLGLPTEQFAAHGTERRLARHMAIGRLPEAQRLETRHGQHNVDFCARMAPRRGELLAYVETMRGHPWLSENADLDRMSEMIEHWPEQSDWSWETGYPRMLALPRMALAAQFIAFVEGRNDL